MTSDVHIMYEWIKRQLASHQELIFDEGVFYEACKEIGQGDTARLWARALTSLSTMEEVIGAVPDELQEKFFAAYLELFAHRMFV